MRKYLLIIICLFATATYSIATPSVTVNPDMNSFFKPADIRTANATCFMYPSGDFKCACRFSDNSKLWASKEIAKITGLSGGNPRYGIIDGCNK